MADTIRAILFDMDGVLVSAKDWHFEALNRALSHHGYAPIAYPEHLAQYDGLPTREKLAALAQKQSIPAAQLSEINDLKQVFTVEIAQERCAPLPQHVESLRRLKEEGYRMAVCSNSIRASLDLLMEKTALQPFFEFTLSNQDVRQPKPDPEIYLTAMTRMKVAPAETLILEDNAYGIQAARASGAHVTEIADITQVTYAHIMDAIARLGKKRHAS